MSLARVVRPERLDALPPDDPDARRSRRDLVRVHLAMGTRGIAARGWRTLLAAEEDASAAERARPARILELGAGDGTLALAIARRLAPALPNVELTLLDRQDIVAPRTRAALDALGWRTRVEVADVLDWAADEDVATGKGETSDGNGETSDGNGETNGRGAVSGGGATNGGELRDRWDLVAASLFLHHFDGEALASLLRAVAARANACFAFEPRRDRLALLGSHLVGALGTNAVTRTDAVLSVHAGFRGEELSAAWPGATETWRFDEGAAGPFGHAFVARRRTTGT